MDTNRDGLIDRQEWAAAHEQPRFVRRTGRSSERNGWSRSDREKSEVEKDAERRAEADRRAKLRRGMERAQTASTVERERGRESERLGTEAERWKEREALALQRAAELQRVGERAQESRRERQDKPAPERGVKEGRLEGGDRSGQTEQESRRGANRGETRSSEEADSKGGEAPQARDVQREMSVERRREIELLQAGAFTLADDFITRRR